ncbi:MAG: hypothetical protein J5493_01780 [Lachnospiraceae bacterium]|nr:hypothetical protein [Lachnospiraceae bacterium]
MKKSAILILALIFTLALSACGKKTSPVLIAVPNDPTNEGRALLLLEAHGLIKLKDGAGLTATIQDIAENPYKIEFREVEAAQIPNIRQDVDFAVINTNYALAANIDPAKEALLVENSESPYVNILAVKSGNENTPLVKALAAALTSQKVVDYINNTYAGQVVAAVKSPTDGFDSSIDYAALAGQKISVACSPSPHAEILELVKGILAEKNITLDIRVFEDYVIPNTAVEDGEIDANYFQHVPYLDEFNESRGTHLVNVAGVHIEPLCLYGGKQTDLKAFGK